MWIRGKSLKVAGWHPLVESEDLLVLKLELESPGCVQQSSTNLQAGGSEASSAG